MKINKWNVGLESFIILRPYPSESDWRSGHRFITDGMHQKSCLSTSIARSITVLTHFADGCMGCKRERGPDVVSGPCLS